MKVITLILCLIFNPLFKSVYWGFYAHKKINRLAVFTLPPEMVPFYKLHIIHITERAVNPDKRRYLNENEAPRHYIDIDAYGDSALYFMPRNWHEAVERYSKDTLEQYGIVPWHIHSVKRQLTQAFKDKDSERIIKLSADLGHYIADANVPLHTTRNYNGQLTGQKGIHGFWESRIPELFAEGYDFFLGDAEYIKDTQARAWQAVVEAHIALDSVLLFEKRLTDKFSESKKYSYEDRNGRTVKVYAYEFSEKYHDMLAGQVEQRMKASVKMIGDFWYTCWVDAGQPDLNNLMTGGIQPEEKLPGGSQNKKMRNHESGIEK